MKTAILKVQSLDDSFSAFSRVWKSGVSDTTATIGFATPDLMHASLTPERWRIVKMLCGAGALKPVDIASRIGRDQVSVKADLDALIKAGVLERDQGGVICPYDNVTLDLPKMGTIIV